MSEKLDTKRPYGKICGLSDIPGALYEQDGKLFNHAGFRVYRPEEMNVAANAPEPPQDHPAVQEYRPPVEKSYQYKREKPTESNLNEAMKEKRKEYEAMQVPALRAELAKRLGRPVRQGARKPYLVGRLLQLDRDLNRT